jgi:hypothetical protein
MNDDLISLYIDDELDLEEKIVFVETVHESRLFKETALDLLQQEKLIGSEVVDRTPVPELRVRRQPWRLKIFKPMAAAAALAAAAVIVFTHQSPQEPLLRPHRFVIYQPEASRVEITGSFIDWRKIPLTPAGRSGYWEITIDLPTGDHRFSYIVEGNRRLADPTVPVREADDFGGENSILTVTL